MFRSGVARVLVVLCILVSLLIPLISSTTAFASGKVTATAASASLNEGSSQQYEIKLSQPIICPSLPDGEICEVVLNFSSSDPTRISFSVPQVTYLPSEWAQSRYVTVTTTRDFIYTSDLAQTITITGSGTAAFYNNSVSSTALTINNLDEAVITGSSEFAGNRDEAIPINDLHVSGDGSSTVTLNLYVASGSLSLPNSSGVSFNGATTGKNLNVSGTRDDMNTALTNLTFTPFETSDVVMQVTVDGLAKSIYNPLNRHLYQVGATGTYPTWSEANTTAQSSLFQNTAGYLATIASQQEQETMFKLGVGGWLGARDNVAEGDWKWTDGPEVGTSFWSGDASGAAVANAFTNWSTGMPDNYTGSNVDGEDCLQYYSHNGKWNDQNCNAQQSPDFIVEYGSSTEPVSLNYKDITIHVTPGRDLNNDGMEDVDQPNVADIQGTNNAWVSIETNFMSDCIVSNTGVVHEANLETQDSDYDYTNGLLGFTGRCSSPLSHTDVRIFYYDATLDGVSLRKYNPTTHQYAPVDTATLEQQHINGHDVVVATYHMFDGNALDTDGDPVNGQWSDPVGFATAAPIVPPSSPQLLTTTPQNLSKSGQNVAVVLILGAGLLAVTGTLTLKKKKTKK